MGVYESALGRDAAAISGQRHSAHVRRHRRLGDRGAGSRCQGFFRAPSRQAGDETDGATSGATARSGYLPRKMAGFAAFVAKRVSPHEFSKSFKIRVLFAQRECRFKTREIALDKIGE